MFIQLLLNFIITSYYKARLVLQNLEFDNVPFILHIIQHGLYLEFFLSLLPNFAYFVGKFQQTHVEHLLIGEVILSGVNFYACFFRNLFPVSFLHSLFS